MQTNRQGNKGQVDKGMLTLFPCLLVLVLAAFLRLYRLDAQSLWNDEGNSARLSERTLESITIGTASDIHPPLYYYALHFWRAVFGQSEFALRALSVVCGVLLVWLIYLIGRQVFDKQVALVAALIAAVNPFQIYYAQEARMYAMLALWAAASMYCVLRIACYAPQGMEYGIRNTEYGIRNTEYGIRITCLPTRQAFYVLFSVAGLYTQYTFVFMLLIHNLLALAFLLVRREQWLRHALTWAAAQAAIVALYLPWLPIALARTGGWGVEKPVYELGAALADVARLFAYGVTLPTEQAGLGLAALGLFMLAGIGFTSKEKAWSVGALLVWWLVPVALIFGLGLYREAYLKFLLVSSAPMCLLAAYSIVSAWRAAGRYAPFRELKGAGSPAQTWQGFVMIMVVLAAMPLTQSLSNLYFEPAYQRDDYRGIAQWARSMERPGDAVLLIAPNQWEVFTYYYTDADRVYPLARQRPPDPTAVDAELRDIAARRKRWFVLYWGDGEADPRRVYEAWMEANTFKVSEQWWGKVRAAMYVVPQLKVDAPDAKLSVRLGQDITLRGYSLLERQLGAGDVIQLTLFWQTEAKLGERYKVFVHLLDGGGRIVAQVDREPGADLVPTTIWRPGEMVVDRYGVLVPPGTPPGRYELGIGMYDLNGNRLPTQDAKRDALSLGMIEVR